MEPNPERKENHRAPTLQLTTSDKEAIETAIRDSPVEIVAKKISNPANDLQNLYIKICSENRSDLYKDTTINSVKQAAKAIGYKPTSMKRGDFPATSTIDGKEQYTLTFRFYHR